MTGPTGSIGPTGPTGAAGTSITGPTGPTYYDLVGYWRGLLPSDDTPIHYLQIIRSLTLPINLTGSVATCLVAPSADVSLVLAKNGSPIGSMNFANGETTGTFTFTSEVSFVSGDTWEVDPPSPQDSTFAGLSWTIAWMV